MEQMMAVHTQTKIANVAYKMRINIFKHFFLILSLQGDLKVDWRSLKNYLGKTVTLAYICDPTMHMEPTKNSIALP